MGAPKGRTRAPVSQGAGSTSGGNQQQYLFQHCEKMIQDKNHNNPIIHLSPSEIKLLREELDIGESYERFVRKRTLVKYQSQSEVIKMMFYRVTVTKVQTKFFEILLYPYVLYFLRAQESKSAFEKFKYGSYPFFWIF